jgi:SAM-dependent methyltransferase
MTDREHVARYHAGQRQSAAWQADRQHRLKQRVYETFDQLLEVTRGNGFAGTDSIIDLGAGSGSFVNYCRVVGHDAVGVDIGDGIDLERDALPFPAGSFDVATGISIVEHLHSPANLLAEACRLLKPGGALILVCPNWHYSMRSFYDDPTHVRPYTPASIRKLFAMYGFERATVVPWLVKKPAWMWFVPYRFFFAYRLIPFRGDAPGWIPSLLKGRSASILAVGYKPQAPA